jgi:PAB-dependent poly(A)-specific ribonuclease subunit 3
VLEFEARKQLGELQKEDIVCIGRLVLSLATRSIVDDKTDPQTLSNCVAFVAVNFSPELHALTVALLTEQRSIFDVCGMMAGHMIDELDVAHSTSDAYESQLLNEYESGRSLRLLMKLGFVNERPEYGVDKQWSETGDRYVLKLFRDFVFHQADEGGNPVLDVGHVVSSLNKLDTGDAEKIVLASRDGQALLVVSYADVQRCLENAYDELLAKNAAAPASGVGMHVQGGQGGGQQQVVNELSFGMMAMMGGGGGRGY